MAWRWSGVEGAVSFATAHPLRALEYAVAAAGSPFTSSWSGQRRFGAALMLLEGGALLVALKKRIEGERVPLGVWLVLLALASRLLMAGGRLVGADGQSVPSRYAAFMTIGNAGLYAAALHWTSRRAAGARILYTAVALFLGIGAATGYVEGWRAGPAERDMRLRIAQLLETIDFQDDETVRRWVYPNSDHARSYARSLAAHRLNVFAARRPDPSALARTGGVRFYLDGINGVHVPRGESVELQPSDLIQLSGWAFESAGSRSLSRAVAVVGGTAIEGAYGIHRPDVAETFGAGLTAETGFGVTFSAAALKPGEHWLSLQFVTADGQRVFQTPDLARLIVRSSLVDR